MGVDRCICRNVTFDEIKAAARQGDDAEAVCTFVGCGDGCTMCLPYIRRLLHTGQTDQPVMTRAELEYWMRPAPGGRPGA